MYPPAINPKKVGRYSTWGKSGGGSFYDDVLEYRVWTHPKDGSDDLCFSFETYEEALEFSKNRDDAEKPLVLVEQLEWVDEPKPGVFKHMKEKRLTEWQPEWLTGSKRGNDTIPYFLKSRGAVNVTEEAKLHKDDFARFVGLFSAHMVWMLETGETIVPLIARQQGRDQFFERLHGSDYEKIVEFGRSTILKKLRKENDFSLIIFDGFWKKGKRKVPALTVEAYVSVHRHEHFVQLIVPYRSLKHKKGLGFGKPAILQTNIADTEYFNEEFLNGTKLHENGARLWEEKYDEKIK